MKVGVCVEVGCKTVQRTFRDKTVQGLTIVWIEVYQL